MGDIILLSDGNGGLRRMKREPYSKEDLLQKLIAQCPEVLAGDDMGLTGSVPFLLVRREASVTDPDSGAQRWSVDHIFVDESARLTLVEVKRSSDVRIRREVVGQLLEYAANAQATWTTADLIRMAEAQHGGEEGLRKKVLALKGASDDEDGSEIVEQFWKQVAEKLRTGNLRLLFVADKLPTELRKVIEFLNSQMTRTDVLGVEVGQYEGDGHLAYVPRVIGSSEISRSVKRSSGSTTLKTDEGEFLDLCGNSAVAFEAVLNKARDRDLTIYWGQKGFSIRVPRKNGQLNTILCGYPPGANGSDVPYWEVHADKVEGLEVSAAVKELFRSLNTFQPHGQSRLKMINPSCDLGDVDAMVQALDKAVDLLALEDQ